MPTIFSQCFMEGSETQSAIISCAGGWILWRHFVVLCVKSHIHTIFSAWNEYNETKRFNLNMAVDYLTDMVVTLKIGTEYVIICGFMLKLRKILFAIIIKPKKIKMLVMSPNRYTGSRCS